MFGLLNTDLEIYKSNIEEFATQEVTPAVSEESSVMSPAIIDEDGDVNPDIEFAETTMIRVEMITIMTTLHASYTYAYLRNREAEEKDIEDVMYTKYINYLMQTLIHYGISFDEEVLDEIVGLIMFGVSSIYNNSVQIPFYKHYDNEDFKTKSGKEEIEEYLNENDINDIPEEFNKELEKFKSYQKFIENNNLNNDGRDSSED